MRTRRLLALVTNMTLAGILLVAYGLDAYAARYGQF